MTAFPAVFTCVSETSGELCTDWNCVMAWGRARHEVSS